MSVITSVPTPRFPFTIITDLFLTGEGYWISLRRAEGKPATRRFFRFMLYLVYEKYLI